MVSCARSSADSASPGRSLRNRERELQCFRVSIQISMAMLPVIAQSEIRMVSRGTGSTVTALTNSAGEIVAYLADNPNAEYIRAGLGAISNSARNTLQLPGINNLDFSIFKNFRMGENRRIQVRADFFNAFNHPQYIPGSPNDIQPVATVGVGQVNTITAATISAGNPGAATFNRADRVFSSNPRTIQLALRFNF